jgi:quercetin dioxygenase-like cupin family protein
VPVRHTPNPHTSAPARAELESALASEAVSAPRWWSNAPADVYGRHAHAYRKVLFCAEGSITFHTDDGDVTLRPGDRLVVEPGTAHGATVGPEGVTCVEASA